MPDVCPLTADDKRSIHVSNLIIILSHILERRRTVKGGGREEAEAFRGLCLNGNE